MPKHTKRPAVCALLLCACLLCACTPAAYDGGTGEAEESDEELVLEAVDVSGYMEAQDLDVYLKDADTSQYGEDGQAYKVAWLCNDMTDEQMAYVTKCMKELASEYGIELLTFDAQSDPQKQTDQINQAIIQQCDAVIITPVDASAENIAMMKARDAGLAVVCSIITTSDEDSFDVYVGPSDTTSGQLAASIILNGIPDGGSVVVIEGQMGSAAQINRDLGFNSVMSGHDEITILESQTGNWTTVEAMNVMESFLAKYEDIDAVYCHNDAEALGAVQAIENAGRDDIIVVGTDGMQSVIDLIEEGGVMYGTPYLPVYETSKLQLLAAFAILNGDGGLLEKMTYIDMVCVLQENASSIESGWGGE